MIKLLIFFTALFSANLSFSMKWEDLEIAPYDLNESDSSEGPTQNTSATTTDMLKLINFMIDEEDREAAINELEYAFFEIDPRPYSQQYKRYLLSKEMQRILSPMYPGIYTSSISFFKRHGNYTIWLGEFLVKTVSTKETRHNVRERFKEHFSGVSFEGKTYRIIPPETNISLPNHLDVLLVMNDVVILTLGPFIK